MSIIVVIPTDFLLEEPAGQTAEEVAFGCVFIPDDSRWMQAFFAEQNIC